MDTLTTSSKWAAFLISQLDKALRGVGTAEAMVGSEGPQMPLPVIKLGSRAQLPPQERVTLRQ